MDAKTAHLPSNSESKADTSTWDQFVAVRDQAQVTEDPTGGRPHNTRDFSRVPGLWVEDLLGAKP
jgi:hypothetical protein